MKASIVICSYNQGQFIGDTLKSITSQKGLKPGELEIILIDGGSTDGTLEVVARYRNKLDIVISEPDRGQSDALMKGFNLATGEVQGWLCSDDVIEPDAIREVLDYFQEHPQDQFIYGDALFINREGQVFETKREIEWNSFVWLHDHNYIRQPSAFWRKTLYEKVGGINPELKACMDPELFSRFALVTRPVHVRGIWSRLRMYPEIKSFRMREAHEAVQRVILSRFDANYRWPMQRPIYWAVAKGLRTYFKIQQHCYSDSHFSQLMCLFSKRRWKEMFGVWDFTADSNR